MPGENKAMIRGWVVAFDDGNHGAVDVLLTASRAAKVRRIMPRVARIGGLAAILGGTLWVAGIALIALGVAPLYREFGFSGTVLWVAVPLLVAGVLGLWAGYGGRAGGMGTGVAVLTIVGTALFAVSAVFGLPWALVMLGFYGAGLGSLLMGAVALQVGALPRPVAAALIGGSAALYFFNDQAAATALMALPFGAAWVAVGFALVGKKESVPADRSARAG